MIKIFVDKNPSSQIMSLLKQRASLVAKIVQYDKNMNAVSWRLSRIPPSYE